MRDSITPATIPLENLAAVAGYDDGDWAWPADGWARFQPPIVRLTIAVHAQDAADILDVEKGDATPAEVPGWCDRFDRPHRRAPSVYCNLDNWPACIQAAGSRRVDWWVADYVTADPTQVYRLHGAVAVQHWDFGGYDQSVIFDPVWIGGGVMTMAEAQLEVWQWYTNYCGRIGTLAEVDYWAGLLIAPGANYLGVVTAFYSSDEAVAWRTAHP